MAKFAETLVIEYLNRNGYLTVRSIKCGNSEWDILAIKQEAHDLIAKHIEVQVSFDPVSYLSNKNARRRSDEEVIPDMAAWVKKKFDQAKIAEIRKYFYLGKWSYCFIHGVLKDQRELAYLRQREIETIEFAEVISCLCSSHPRNLPFTGGAKDIVELLRYAKNMGKA